MSEEKFKVSVVVPVYNGEQHINKCCKNLIDQTIKEIQIIFVDDGSTDGSWECMRKCAEMYNNVSVIHQDNQGVSVARNTGLEKCSAEYIGFMDVDDTADPDMYESLYKLAKTKDLDVIGMEPIGATGEITIFDNRSDALKMLFIQKIRMAVWNKLFRASVAHKVQFPIGIRMNEDLVFVYSALKIAERIGSINVEKYHYIRWEGSSSRQAVFSEKTFDVIKVADYIYADSLSCFPELALEAEARKARSYLRVIKLYYMRKKPEIFRKQILELKQYLNTLDKLHLKRYFGKYDIIRYILYFYCKPLFIWFTKTIDR